jgi:DNA (cytosine-5)-methyltransferase 1
MNELALFAGAGGGILGGHLLGWRTVCAVEWEPYPASVLVARQNDKVLPPFPIWDDVQTFDGKPWRGIAQVVSGGFPCQDISAAGKGKGITGERSSMWKHMARIIGEVRPKYVLVENSPMLTIRGLGVVLGDLSKMGFDAEWGVISAADIGAPHLRERIWIVATNVGNTYLHGISSSNDQQVLQRKSNWKKKDFKQFEGSSSSDNPNVANTYCNSDSESIRGIMEQKEREQREDQQVHITTRNIGGTNSHEWGNSMLGLESISKESKESNVANLSSKGGQWESSIQTNGCSGGNYGQTNASNAKECGEMEGISNVADTSVSGFTSCNHQASRPKQSILEEQSRRSCNEYRANRYTWPSEPNVGRVVNGMAARVDRLKAIGNGQVSGVAATAWRILNEL